PPALRHRRRPVRTRRARAQGESHGAVAGTARAGHAPVVTPPTDLLSGIAICVAAAALLALVGWRLRQPLILAYLLAGVVIGPIGLRWVTDLTSIQTVAEIGLILLLFVIGLEIDLKKL